MRGLLADGLLDRPCALMASRVVTSVGIETATIVAIVKVVEAFEKGRTRYEALQIERVLSRLKVASAEDDVGLVAVEAVVGPKGQAGPAKT